MASRPIRAVLVGFGKANQAVLELALTRPWLQIVGIVIRSAARDGESARDRVTGADVVTARAVAPLGKLSAWCLPLLRVGGLMVALKGASAAEEIERDRAEIRRAGGGDPRIERCGTAVVDPPTTVVVVERLPRRTGKDQRARRG